jgi:hypothetical protein
MAGLLPRTPAITAAAQSDVGYLPVYRPGLWRRLEDIADVANLIGQFDQACLLGFFRGLFYLQAFAFLFG